jgi:hypothetical protein
MKSGKIPDFLANGSFAWDRLDYEWSESPPIDLLSAKALASSDPWIRLAAAVEHAKHGDHSGISKLGGLIHLEPPAALLTRAVLDVIGTAGTTADLKMLAAAMTDSDYLAKESCRAASCAGELWLIQHMIEAWRRVRSFSDRETMRMRIASILEDWDGPIVSSIIETDDEFVELVQQRVHQLQGDGAKVNTAFLLGRPSNPTWLAKYMLALTRSDIDRHTLTSMFYLLRHQFEASTGIAWSAFFKQGVLQPLSAAAILEEYTVSSDPSRFDEGVRYFFGHRIPD